MAETITQVSDDEGNTYVSSSFKGTVELGSISLTSTPNPYGQPSIDVYVAKLDPRGNYLWAVRLGGAGDDQSIDLVRAPTGILYLLGHLGAGATLATTQIAANRGFIARLDGAGTLMWARETGNAESRKIATNAAGSVLLAASSSLTSITVANTVFTNPGTIPQPPYQYTSPSSDGFVAKLSADGVWQWVRQIAGPEPAHLGTSTAVALDAEGNAYVTGALRGRVDLGSTTLTSTAQQSRAYVAKLSPTGDWLWAVSPAAPVAPAYVSQTSSQQLAVSPSGSVYWLGALESPGGVAHFGPSQLTATAGGYGDIFVAKLTSQGEFKWAAQSSGYGNDIGLGLALDKDENAYVTGSSYSDSPSNTIRFGETELLNAGSSDVFVAKLAATGTWQWAVRAGGTGYDRGTGLAPDNQGGVYITGTAGSQSVNFGPVSLAPSATAGYGFWAHVSTSTLPVTSGQASKQAGLQLAPNPCQTAVRITGPSAHQAVQFHDALGRLVLLATMPTAGPLHISLPSSLTPGLYIVRSGSLSQRLIIE
ncbi:SBBP repeat-containing protein [Hymenobacter fodinae]|uniref:Uncharacterized protein n=1 Tax=Hymenobacter fodinae TaxID=2510796 RepID=A0A4Z0P221_9BACT|nr:SBBP repeat-containing protein [Hymenobacter fodinae]TGE04810.1 hypothetical protein EU556_21765 [Hymenobacter fodinae]